MKKLQPELPSSSNFDNYRDPWVDCPLIEQILGPILFDVRLVSSRSDLATKYT